MDTLFELLNNLVAQITNAPVLVLLLVSLFGIGRLIKEVGWPPPRFIPLILCAVSVGGTLWLGMPGEVPPQISDPNAVLVFVGLTLWLVAWIVHKAALQYLEDWIEAKVSAFLGKNKPKETNESSKNNAGGGPA